MTGNHAAGQHPRPDMIVRRDDMPLEYRGQQDKKDNIHHKTHITNHKNPPFSPALAQEKQSYAELFTDTAHYSIAAVHYPDTFAELENCSIDLCLAGHSLGGQIYIPVVNMFRRDYGCQQYYRGKTNRNGTVLDITNGIGRRKTDARLWADAELVFYKLNSMNSN